MNGRQVFGKYRPANPLTTGVEVRELPHAEVARSPTVDLERVSSDQAPLVFPGRFRTRLRVLRVPRRIGDQASPDDVPFVEEDALTGDELRKPPEEFGREGLGPVNRVRVCHERKHCLEV